MAKFSKDRIHEIVLKQQVLERARIQLLKEFVGIDRVIDTVIDSISPWYLFPDFQEKPMVINLWGLTGVGKTSLVNRLVELLSFEEKYHHFDLGEQESRGYILKERLIEIYEFMNGTPMILALDEFQHARTLSESGFEAHYSAPRVIWQLIDSGRFQITRHQHRLDNLHDHILSLKHMLNNGVVVENGLVVENIEYFLNNSGMGGVISRRRRFEDYDEEDCLFVGTGFLDTIFEMAREFFNNPLEVEERLRKMNGSETIDFMEEVFARGNSPKIIDCSKALIFVLGNLDEAYQMTSDFNPDMDADEFHEQSLHISTPMIKKALQRRFRSEQISRLGNQHIIYPAFNKIAFHRIIQLELDKIRQNVHSKHQVGLWFDQSVYELIYREGVYPTQGTRPVFSTINQLIKSKLGRIMSEILLSEQDIDGVVLKAVGSFINAGFLKGSRQVHSIRLHQDLPLERLRAIQKDDTQAITAVHESGHAVIACILLNTAPEVVYSTTATAGQAGFMYAKFNWKYISRKEISSRLALFLGGYAAEKLVFGDENLTAGAEDDIQKATGFITEMLKQCGMGSLPAAYQSEGVETRNFLHDTEKMLNLEVERAIQDGLALAERTLKAQEPLLLRMADHLSDNRQLSKQQIIALVQTHALDFNAAALSQNNNDQPYRRMLKGKVARLQTIPHKTSPGKSYDIMLNRKDR